MFKVRLVLALSAGAILAAAAPAQPDAEKPKTPEELRAEYVEDIAAAHDLAAFAGKYKVPEAYIDAASMLMKVHAQTNGKMGTPPKEVTVIDAGNKETKAAVAAGPSLKQQAEAWFDDARGLTTDKALRKKITDAEKRDYRDPADRDVGLRGKSGGPAHVGRTIPPNEVHVYHWKFDGGQKAAIAMSAHGNLGIKIVGPNGGQMFALVGGRAMYQWMPGKTDTFIVRVHNGTKQPVPYTLVSN